MANTKAIYPSVIRTEVLDIANADSTNLQTLVTAGASGSRINSIAVTSTDSFDKDLMFYINDGAADYLIGRITIPDGSGSNGIDQTISALNVTNFPFIGDDLCLYLEANYLLKVKAQAAVTAATYIYLVATVGDY